MIQTGRGIEEATSARLFPMSLRARSLSKRSWRRPRARSCQAINILTVWPIATPAEVQDEGCDRAFASEIVVISGTPHCVRFGFPEPLSYANARETPVAPSGKSAGKRGLTVVLLEITALDRGRSAPSLGRMVSMALAELMLFGGFELRRSGGEVIDLPGQKERALLAVLALRPGASQSRDKLAGLLWGDRAEKQA